MAHYIGSVEPFDPTTTTWQDWQDRFDCYVQLNEITTEAKQRQLLSLTVGVVTYKLLADLIRPATIKETPVANLLAALRTHFTPKKLIIAERNRFYLRSQKEGEKVCEYEAQLRFLAKDCAFGAFLNEALRDRLVIGLRNEAVKRRLLGEDNLELPRAIELASSMETADKDSHELSRSQGITNGTVNQFQRRKPTVPTNLPSKCYRCGQDHDSSTCRFKEAICNSCKKVGHLAKMCRSSQASHANRSAQQQQKKKFVKRTGHSNQVDEQTDIVHVDVNSAELPGKYLLQVDLNGHKISFELDTGAAVTIINEFVWNSIGSPNLRKCPLKLNRYGNVPIKVIGTADVKVSLTPGSSVELPLIVVKGDGCSLLGRTWIVALKLNLNKYVKGADVHGISQVAPTDLIEPVLNTFQEVFKPELGHCANTKAKLLLKSGAVPRFFKARPMPFAMKAKVEADLLRLEKLGVLTPIQTAEWAAPIVAVPKPNGTVRVCGDYKVTVNPWLDVDVYPLPRPEELFAALNGGQKFSKIDLSEAYLQVELEESSRHLLVINTHKGLYQCNRLMYGVASAPAIFQKLIDGILPRRDGIVTYMDDILITGKSDTEHIENVRQVLSQLQSFGLRIRREKCQFLQDTVEYLGRIVDKNGIHVSPRKVSAVLDITAPKDQSQLRSFLGMINHYGRFVKTLADLSVPLNNLLKKDVDWKWSAQHQKCFEALKIALTTAPVLAHFDPAIPVGLICDASAVGIGAVLFHRYPDGSERPISYASKTLTSAEQHYAQIEREGLGIIFGVKKFHQYVYGHPFILVTDHQPLVKIFGPKTGIPVVSASRLQRWAIILAGYTYSIEYRRTDKMGNADCLSRLPVGTDSQFETTESFGSVVNCIQTESVRTASAMTSKSVAKWTLSDPTLQQVLKHVLSGFPNKDKLSPEEKPYAERFDQLATQGDCILFGLRVVIPTALRKAVLQELHAGHPGIVRMKNLARQYVWWPGIDKDIEAVVNGCDPCQEERKDPPAAPIHFWEEPKEVWDRVHIDFAGPFVGKTWLIIVDAKSGWPEVYEMPSTTSEKTVDALRETFARFGLPRQIVSDNGPQFTSTEFAEFCNVNGIRHSLSSPYHPRSNGMAERFVQTFKTGVKTELNQSGKTLKQIVANVLLHYRVTPNSAGKSPSEQMFSRGQVNTKLSLLRPQKMSSSHEGETSSLRVRKFEPQQSVWARNYRGPKKWSKGVITSVLGPLSYHVQVGKSTWKRHADQLRNRVGNVIDPDSTDDDESNDDPLKWDGYKSDPPPQQRLRQPIGPIRGTIPVLRRDYNLRSRKAGPTPPQ